MAIIVNVKMLFLVIALSCASGVMGGCGTCEVVNTMSHLDKLQAQAFNKMSGSWSAVSIPENAESFVVSKGGGFGPTVCGGKCKPNWWHGGRTTCTYKTKEYTTSFNGRIRSTDIAIGVCAKKYHDKNSRLCRSIPQWNNYWEMWCHTWHSGRASNWGKTHFPICSTTNKMCQPYSKE